MAKHPGPPRACPAEDALRLVVFLGLMLMGQQASLPADEPVANAFEAADDAGETSEQNPAGPSVLLPNDRGQERQLDRCRRLIEAGRWADAVVILDELLASDSDAFVEPANPTAPKSSIRAEVERTVASLPRAGRDAYLLLVRARADRQLTAAIAGSDSAAIEEVARRWFHSPAGQRAGILIAFSALESGEPLTAATWLDRLEATGSREFEPSLTFMRALARHQAGDLAAAVRVLETVGRKHGGIARITGREESLSAAAARPAAWLEAHGGRQPGADSGGEDGWHQLGGRPARTTTVNASRPLLVPRYRVPLVRHPAEARQLEQRRRAAADTGHGLVPAATPLAVGDALITHTPLGILAIDFDSGRRIWLASSVPVAGARADDEGWADPRPAAGDRGDRMFDDATSGNLASDGRLVFAVESPAEALAAELTINGFGGRGFFRAAADWHAGNRLTAYDLEAGGAVRWQMAGPDQQPADASGEAPWYLGGPLVVGDALYVLVERQGEVSLDVLAAADGSRRWSQVLATYDEEESIANPAARGRRLAGLTPAFADGLVVCPVGGGCLVAVDTTSRALAWACSYPRAAVADPRRQAAGGELATAPIQRSDPCPVIARGRVLVTPYDADLLLCLDARTGSSLWSLPARGQLRITGVTDNAVIVTGRSAVEAVDLDTGRVAWHWPCPEGSHPSGRGLVTGQTVLLPLDSPELVEINLVDGSLRGRSPARGGVIPGNLVPHRGEIVCQGLDSLDVFHQEAALEERIETALEIDPADPWAVYWRAQTAIEHGNVADGLDGLAAAAQSPRFQIPPGGIAGSLERAMRRDFAAVRARWPIAGPAVADAAATAPTVARMMVDGCLADGDAEAAWGACQSLLAAASRQPADPELILDPIDSLVTLTPDRWLRSRLDAISALATDGLAQRIDDTWRAAVAAASEQATAQERFRRLEQLVELLGHHPAAAEATRRLRADAGFNRDEQIRRELVTLIADPDGDGLDGPLSAAADDAWPSLAAVDAAWPFGRVESRRLRRTESDGPQLGGMQAIPLPVIGGDAPNARVTQAVFALGDRELIVTDPFGRPVGEPVLISGSWGRGGLPWTRETGLIEVAVLGRLLFVRTGDALSCHDLDAGSDTDRLLWSREEFGQPGTASGSNRWGGGIGSRMARDGGIPLGMRIVEPEDPGRGGGRGMVPLPQGLVVPGRGAVALLDPATGRVLWQRHGVAPGMEWIADAEYLCGCTTSGRGSVVLSLAGGRLLEQCDLPDRRQRLPVAGRRIVAVHSIDELPGRFTARRVRLELVDPVNSRLVSLGEFPGESRAVETGDGRLAVMTPDGLLTVLDLGDGEVVLQTSLPDPPRRFERLLVKAWHDRYLVLAGGSDEADADDLSASALQPLLAGPVAMPPLSGSIWAVGRTSGELLWPAAAVVERQYLLPRQPEAAPVMIFCRLLPSETTARESLLSVLCLDKRTGHAVVEDERVPIHPHQAFGCQVVADAATHSVTIAGGEGGDRLQLLFTGQSMPPQPPFLGTSRPPSAAGIAGFLRRAAASPAGQDPSETGERSK